uniref:Uncharacterized protein n=1 Tax=Arundo donax TaxID=35708 RepID=A0A0A9G315_ARUDO
MTCLTRLHIPHLLISHLVNCSYNFLFLLNGCMQFSHFVNLVELSY